LLTAAARRCRRPAHAAAAAAAAFLGEPACGAVPSCQQPAPLPPRRLTLALVCKQLFHATRSHGACLWEDLCIGFCSASTLHSFAAWRQRCACAPQHLMVQVSGHVRGMWNGQRCEMEAWRTRGWGIRELARLLNWASAVVPLCGPPQNRCCPRMLVGAAWQLAAGGASGSAVVGGCGYGANRAALAAATVHSVGGRRGRR